MYDYGKQHHGVISVMVRFQAGAVITNEKQPAFAGSKLAISVFTDTAESSTLDCP